MNPPEKKKKKIAHGSTSSKEDRFVRRWIDHDYRVTDQLQSLGVATYEWKENYDKGAMRLESLSLDDPSLPGSIYDIVFCHGVPDGTDQGYIDEWPVSRAATTAAGLGTLTFEVDEAGDLDEIYGMPHEDQVLCGTVRLNKNLVREDDGTGTWEMSLQPELTIRQVPEDYFGYGESFRVAELDGMDAPDDLSCSLWLISNSGVLSWIPTEENPFANDKDNDQYLALVREKLVRRHSGIDRTTDSWLCRHMNLPVHVAQHVHSYLSCPLPNCRPEWKWQEGDLLLRVNFSLYATNWTTHYVARRRTSSEVSQP
jgi:hypothetical protein